MFLFFSGFVKSSTRIISLNPLVFNLLTRQLPIKPAAPVTMIIFWILEQRYDKADKRTSGQADKRTSGQASARLPVRYFQK